MPKLHPRHFIFSTENPDYPGQDQVNMKPKDAAYMLKKLGEDAHVIKDHYSGRHDEPRSSVLVNNPQNVEALHKLAHEAGQESAIYSDYGNHEMHFYHGPNSGKMLKGQGTVFHEEKPLDNFTTLDTDSGPKHFTHNFNFNKIHDSDALPHFKQNKRQE